MRVNIFFCRAETAAGQFFFFTTSQQKLSHRRWRGRPVVTTTHTQKNELEFEGIDFDRPPYFSLSLFYIIHTLCRFVLYCCYVRPATHSLIHDGPPYYMHTVTQCAGKANRSIIATTAAAAAAGSLLPPVCAGATVSTLSWWTLNWEWKCRGGFCRRQRSV